MNDSDKSGDVFHVYVIELDASAYVNVGAGVVYVGETSKTPEERFAIHMAGGLKAAGSVTKHGLRLRRDLAPEGSFTSREAALEAEQQAANDLRKRGFRVLGGQGKPFMQHE